MLAIFQSFYSHIFIPAFFLSYSFSVLLVEFLVISSIFQLPSFHPWNMLWVSPSRNVALGNRTSIVCVDVYIMCKQTPGCGYFIWRCNIFWLETYKRAFIFYPQFWLHFHCWLALICSVDPGMKTLGAFFYGFLWFSFSFIISAPMGHLHLVICSNYWHILKSLFMHFLCSFSCSLYFILSLYLH